MSHPFKELYAECTNLSDFGIHKPISIGPCKEWPDYLLIYYNREWLLRRVNLVEGKLTITLAYGVRIIDVPCTHFDHYDLGITVR